MSQNNCCGSLVVGHLITFVFCAAFPRFVTAVAPVSWITFQREGDVVSATTRICSFFVIPYSTRTVAPVIGVGDHFVAGTVERRAELSVLVGGLVSLLTVAYLCGMLLTIYRYLLRLSGLGPKEQSRPM